MSTKAPRIPASVWDRYREEITALYTTPDGTLEKVMDAMKARRGFQPTKSQYLTKLKHWGLQKYANALDYMYAGQQIKKRALEGKDTAFNIRGKKMSRKDMEREIGRNTTLTSRLQYVKDILTPEGIQVFTPSGEENLDSIILEANIDNLSEFQALTVQVFHDQFFQSTIYNMPDSHRVQVNILRNPKFGVKLLQMALGDALKLEDSDMFVLIRNPFTGRQTHRNLASYFPPRDEKNDTISCPFRSVDLDMPPQVVALQRLLQYFICLTNNDALEDSHLFDAVNWLLKKFDRSLFTYIFDLRTTTSKIFMRKILAASVNSGDTRLVEDILHRGLDFDYRHPHPYEKNLQERCISIAVQNQNQRMLQLLCRAGFSPQFYPPDKDSPSRLFPKDRDLLPSQRHLPWNTDSLEILRTLLTFNADPEGMLMGVQRGFPLVNAARSGNLGAVDMLLEAGSNVNVYVTNYFGTALQAAVHAKQLELVKHLIEKGADVNAPFGEQYRPNSCRKFRESHHCVAKTPIQIACEMNNMSLVDLLLDHGAYVDLSLLCRITVEEDIENAMSDSANLKAFITEICFLYAAFSYKEPMSTQE
ncbi:Hypothetical protein PENO1_026910 [Penicillium occitanis (nom. inval.)]|nr:Hypothetical protein PENO1_026910 [Penicillium occitanis (nom. inval.)]PCH05354.1 hypothetical protein PENOC_029210 [Penicillium occitanis (nom. inval.)]